ncbi:uncharacterized protein LOC142022701 isoform X2 [Carettochelys insculpta]|uniref:uncharacterized protein LOC142022701 isoform X2 n=1 Tax=Carettochelys insculpta TaxID=44489 RepID=UPI003EBB373A
MSSGGNPLIIAEGDSVYFECCFNGSPAHGNPFYEIIWVREKSPKNISKRILQFRMTRSNTSAPISVTAGHFRGQLEFEKNTSSLFIPEVWMNDSGLYYCEVTITPLFINTRTNGTHLIVTGKPTNKPSLLTHSVKYLIGGLFLLLLLALGMYFKLKRRTQAQKPEVSQELSDPISSTPAPAQKESFTELVDKEMIYSKLQWSPYSMVSSPGRSTHSGEPVTKKPSTGSSDPGTNIVYATLQAQ